MMYQCNMAGMCKHKECIHSKPHAKKRINEKHYCATYGLCPYHDKEVRCVSTKERPNA